MADEENQVDKQGYLTIEKDGIEAKVVPSSFRVWEPQGWKVKQVQGKAPQATQATQAAQAPQAQPESKES